jgi:hypothetical protein
MSLEWKRVKQGHQGALSRIGGMSENWPKGSDRGRLSGAAEHPILKHSPGVLTLQLP